PDGKTTIIDLSRQKEVLVAAIDPKHVGKPDSVYLLDDAQNFYLAINGPKDANNNPAAAAGGGPMAVPIGAMPGGGFGGGFAGNLGVQSGLMPGSGMRSIPVDGYFYAIDRQTGKVRWNSPVPNQTVVLEHFPEMPVIMFTARPFAEMGRGVKNFNMQVTSFQSIEKRTGKRLLDESDIPNNATFHSLNVDLRAGKIELIGHNVK